MKRRCPICRSTKYYRWPVQSQRDMRNRCKVCKYDWTDRSRTIFKGCKLPQEKIDLMVAALEVNPEISSIKLGKLASVQQKTAWGFKRRVLEGPEAVAGYWQGRAGTRVGRHRTRKECAGLAP